MFALVSPIRYQSTREPEDTVKMTDLSYDGRRKFQVGYGDDTGWFFCVGGNGGYIELEYKTKKAATKASINYLENEIDRYKEQVDNSPSDDQIKDQIKREIEYATTGLKLLNKTAEEYAETLHNPPTKESIIEYPKKQVEYFSDRLDEAKKLLAEC
jgi:hypothetical protein